MFVIANGVPAMSPEEVKEVFLGDEEGLSRRAERTPVKGSDAEVVGYVKATPGAIGYASSAPAARVAVLGRY